MRWSAASISDRRRPTTSSKVIAEIKTLNPDVIIPMHCSGDNFIQAVRAQMPEKLVLATTGSRMTFSA